MTHSPDDIDAPIRAKAAFLGLGQESLEALRAFRPIVEERIDAIMDEFYAHVTANGDLRAMLGDAASVERVKAAQRRHWLALFAGKLDGDYVATTRRVGLAHYRTQLSPAWYMGGYCLAFTRFLDLAGQRLSGEPDRLRRTIAAIARVVFLDMDLALGVYYEAIVAERRAAEDEQRRAKEQADTANRAKSTFLANMSHELRTPLTAIIGFAEIMMQESFGPIGSSQYRDYTRDIHTSGRHLLQVINDILDMSRVEAGKLQLTESEVEVNELFDAAVRLVADSAAAGAVHLERRIAPELPRIIADERILKQILLNLLSNAVKFTPAGGRIILSAALEPDDWLNVSVADTGIGIAADKIEKVLAPFVQAENPMQRRYKGVGLGLPLVKAMTEQHGGRFTLRSVPGQGTTTTVLLPPSRLSRGERNVARVRA